jgi:hypothetical protein
VNAAATVLRREQSGTRRGQTGLRIKVSGYPDRVLEDGGVNVVSRVDVDATHNLDQLARFSQIVAAGLVHEIKRQEPGHSQLSEMAVPGRIGLGAFLSAITGRHYQPAQALPKIAQEKVNY